MHQLFGNLTVGHIIELIHGYAAVDHCFGKAAQVIYLLLNQTDAEQVLSGSIKHCLRRNGIAGEAFELFHQLLADIRRQLLGNNAGQ